MKRTQIIELIHTIKNTFISFISITMFVLLGVCVFLGFDWTSKDLKYKLNNRYDNDNYHDLQIYYPYGISDEDIQKLKEVSGVDEIEASFYGFEFFKKGNEIGQAKIISLTNDIDLCFELKGRLPENENEILVEEGSAYGQGLNIGDKITFFGQEAKMDYLLNKITNIDDLDLNELIDFDKQNYHYLKSDEVEIVGFIKNPEYLSMSKASYGISTRTGNQVDVILYTNYDSFNSDIVKGYNNVLIRNNNLRNIYTFDNNYIKRSEEFSLDINEVAEKIGKDSYQEIRNKIDNIQTNARKALNDADIKITNAQDELINEKNEWNSNSDKLQSYEITINEAKILLDENEGKLNDAANQIAEGDDKLTAAINEYNIQKEKINHYKATYNEIKEAAQRIYAYFNSGLQTIELGPDVSKIINRENIETIIKLLSDETIKERIDELEQFEQNKEEIIKLIVDFIVEYLESDHIKVEEITSAVFDTISNIKERLIAVDETRISYLEALNILIQYDDDIFNDTVGEYQSIVDIVWGMLYENVEDHIEIIEQYFGENGLYITIIDYIDSFIMDAFNNIDEILSESYKEIDEGSNLLSTYKKAYYEALEEFNTKKQEFIDATIELENGKKLLDETKQIIEDSQKELDEFKKEYEINKDKYDELVTMTDQVKDYGTIIQTRNVNPGYIYTELLSDIVGKLKINLGGLFLVISLFICYSVVTRNVQDQTKQIGTKKALGISQKEVTLSFVMYSAITIIIGGILGVVSAYFLVEKSLIPLISKSFTFERYAKYLNLKDALLLISFEFILIEAITLYGCRKILKTKTIKLLQGTEPTNGKKRIYEKFHIWDKLSLFSKTIINNAFNDPQRVFATVFGIMGCTALIVGSIMMRNNILKSFDKQYEEYFIFDTMICYDSNNNTASKEIENILKENKVDYSDVYYSIGYVHNDKFDNLLVKEFIYDDIDSFSKLVKFDTHDGSEFDYNGAYLNESVNVFYKLDNQESIIFNESTGKQTNIDLNGFYKYYFYNPILFMDGSTYQKYFNSNKPQNNTFIINTKNIDILNLNNQLKNVDGYIDTFDYYRYCKNDADIFETIANAVVAIYLFISILMSIFVLLNLTVTFVMEKKYELIVLMINGFKRKDAKRYIYLDTIIMTIMGIILGSIVGYFAGNAGIGSFESKYMYLLHNIDFYACIIGISLTALLAFLMSSIAIKKIDNFKLTDINKNN